MQVVETALMQAGEIEKHGAYTGASGTIERVCEDNPDDGNNEPDAPQPNDRSPPKFVRTLRTPVQLEAKDEIGSNLACSLKAEKLYPASEFTQEGINRLVKKVLPEK